MLMREEVESLTQEMHVTPAEMPVLNAMAGLRMCLDEVKKRGPSRR